MDRHKFWNRLAVALVVALMAGGCAAGSAFRRGEAAMRAGDLDGAVAYYRKAVQESPENAAYKIALQRAMLAASRAHLDRAREYEQNDQLEAALGEYKLASEYDPSNRLAATKVIDLDRILRERAEAARPKPQFEQLRERARAASQPPPLLNFTTRMPRINFNNTSLRDILNFIGQATGVNVTFDRQYQDRNYTVQLDGVTLEQALNQILSVNSLAYKILSERSILIFDDNAQQHQKYDDQVIQTFYLSNADATELAQILSQAFRPAGIAIQPAIAPNKAQNSITIRATTPVMGIFEKLIQQNDKPRAEIVVDVEIMEVDRSRTKQYGLNLSDYAIGGIFSPAVAPAGGTVTTTPPATGGTTGTTATGTPVAPTALGTTGAAFVPPFNLNTISRGINTADFYLAVPTAVVRFLESDTHTKVLAKPQLRGAEGQKLTFKTGQQIPVVSTTFLPVATGGAGQNPLASYNYKDVGINLDMTPRVSPEGDILLDLTIDDSSQGPSQTVAGTPNVPTFQQRTVTTRLRLRDGESNLLAGLIQDSQSKVVTGFPGVVHVPILSDALSGNQQQQDQTDVVMLLTPHIVRSTDLTEQDLKPIYIGSQQTFSLGGQPPLLAPPPGTPAPAPAPASPTPSVGQQTPRGTIAVPPGSPVPGTVVVPNAPPAPTTTPAVPTQPQAAGPPPASVQAEAVPTPRDSQQAAATDAPPSLSAGIGGAQIVASPPAGALRVGQGPYNIPLSVTGAQRLSMVTLTLTFDPRFLRVRTVQEGSFMRSNGGGNVTFTQQVANGRVDIIISRGSDALGVSGTGVLAAVLFDAVAPGTVTLTVSGTASGPGNTPMALQFRPVTVTVQ
ncbi:MAG TPA: tetratricopeptide repeat protein [Vicinamibacterales bacterium]|nr:tetratricopeptide repeat protein [Vicinamibacterales bacterium]